MPPPCILLPNVVQLIAEKLTKAAKTNHNNQKSVSCNATLSIPRRVLDETTERLRILEARAKVGTLGKSIKWDGPESRAAVLLAETLRKETNTVVSWKDLENAVGVKASHLEQLHQILSNYLYDRSNATSTTAISAAALPRKRTAFSAALLSLHHLQQQTQQNSSSRQEHASFSKTRAVRHDTNTSAPSSILTDLTIRLPECPHGAADKARLLMDQMKGHILTTASVHERRGLFYDFYRYYAAYEAAAMHFVTKIPCDELVAAASQHLTYLQLKQVLPHVEKIAKQMKSTSTKSNTAPLSSKPNSSL